MYDTNPNDLEIKISKPKIKPLDDISELWLQNAIKYIQQTLDDQQFVQAVCKDMATPREHLIDTDALQCLQHQ